MVWISPKKFNSKNPDIYLQRNLFNLIYINAYVNTKAPSSIMDICYGLTRIAYIKKPKKI